MLSPTVEDFLKYVESIIDAVETQLLTENDPSVKSLLLRLKVLLKSNAINKLIDGLSKHRVNIPACKIVGEIGDALDELYILRLKLPYPSEHFAIEQKKRENAQRTALFILILGLFGFEWELD